jgi:competence protein ComGC
MKPRLSSRPEAGLTLLEVGVIVAIVAILAVVLLPSLQNARQKAWKISCVSNLKMNGLAYTVWEQYHGQVYPMGVSITNGGSMEMVATGNVVQTFMVMSNELSTPEVLWCPADAAHVCASTFGGLSNSNLSYFVDADLTNENSPQAILSGDSHFEIGGKPVSAGLLSLSTNDSVAWSGARHGHSGSLAMADGSVQCLTPAGLQASVVTTGLATNHLAIP